MTKHSHIAVWTGEHWLPTIHFAKMCERAFTTGKAYRLIAESDGSRLATRTSEQNAKMWAMLAEVAAQTEHNGLKLTADKWKVLFMDAVGHEAQLLTSLDKTHIVPYGGRSSHMTIKQMNELLEFIQWWGTEHGVKFASDEGLTWTK